MTEQTIVAPIPPVIGDTVIYNDPTLTWIDGLPLKNPAIVTDSRLILQDSKYTMLISAFVMHTDTDTTSFMHDIEDGITAGTWMRKQ